MGSRRGGGASDAKSSNSTSTKWPLPKPKRNLRVTRLKDNDLFIRYAKYFFRHTVIRQANRVKIQVENLFSSAESSAFVKAAEAMGFAYQGSLGPARGEAYRDNDRIAVNDPALANAIWEAGLNKLLCDIKIRGKVPVGLNPNVRFYRYKVGQRFGSHIDESVDLGGGNRTHYTLLIYLSGGSSSKATSHPRNAKGPSLEPLVGGETVFYGSRNKVVAEVAPLEGMALLHIHGDKCMLHEARIVIKGIKYVLRSDVVFA